MLAGKLTPQAKVAVQTSTFTNPLEKQSSTNDLKIIQNIFSIQKVNEYNFLLYLS